MGARLMKKYLVKVYNKVDNSYRIAMETPDLDMAENKMTRLSNQGHLVKIDMKPNKTPKHLENLPKDKLATLVEIFKPRI
jgi:hypothetical protein